MVFCKQNVNLNEVAEKNLTKKLLIISILLLLNISSINKSSDVTKLKGTSYLSLVLFLEKSSFF
jgi:competence protein ComGC